jgi:hypothetical protein
MRQQPSFCPAFTHRELVYSGAKTDSSAAAALSDTSVDNLPGPQFAKNGCCVQYCLQRLTSISLQSKDRRTSWGIGFPSQRQATYWHSTVHMARHRDMTLEPQAFTSSGARCHFKASRTKHQQGESRRHMPHSLTPLLRGSCQLIRDFFRRIRQFSNSLGSWTRGVRVSLPRKP